MDQSLERFVEKMISLRHTQESKVMSWEDMKAVAIELGLTNEDWAKVETKFNMHTERGHSFLRYENLDDAINEFEQALTIYPYHTHSLFSLASAYALRWRTSGNDDDKTKALKNVEDCLATAPTHEASIKLVSELKRQIQKAEAENPTNKKALAFILIAVFVFIAISLAVFSLIKVEPAENFAEEVQHVQQSAQTETTEVINKTSESFDVFSDWKIPLKFKRDKRSQHLIFDVYNSKFSDYKKTYSYKFLGYIGPKETIEISQLKLRFDLIVDGKVLLTDTKEVISNHNPSARIGDLIPIDYLEYVKEPNMPAFDEVVISVDEILSEPSLGEYEESPRIEFEWANGKPNNYDLEIRERLNSASPNYRKDLSHELVLEFKNTGNVSIERLEYQITHWNKAGKAFKLKPTFATISSYPKIQVGQTRINGGLRMRKEIPYDDYDHYTITIISVK